MNVFQIQLPVRGNDGLHKGYEIAEIMQDIVAITGGLTRTDGIGMWRDSAGIVVTDTIVNVQTYATDGQVSGLNNLVWFWADMLVQDALVSAVWAADVTFVTKGVW